MNVEKNDSKVFYQKTTLKKWEKKLENKFYFQKRREYQIKLESAAFF